MKKLIALVLALICMVSLSSCSLNLTEKSDIISLYQNNEEVFLQAGESGDFSAIEDIKGVQSVYISEEMVDVVSLVQSLKDVKDERVEMQIEEIMEEYKW